MRLFPTASNSSCDGKSRESACLEGEGGRRMPEWRMGEDRCARTTRNIHLGATIRMLFDQMIGRKSNRA